MVTLIAKLLKVLNSEASPWQIGWGVALGLMAGLLPFGLITLVVLLIACLFTINLTTFFVVWGATGGLMFIFGRQIEIFTWQVAHEQTWVLELLASTEILQVLHLHHTMVLGSFVMGLLLMIPVAFISVLLIKNYRLHLMTRMDKWKITQALKASKFFKLYESLN